MAKGKTVVVLLESLAKTGAQTYRQRPKTGDKLEFMAWDPFVQQKVLFKEIAKITSLKGKYRKDK